MSGQDPQQAGGRLDLQADAALKRRRRTERVAKGILVVGSLVSIAALAALLARMLSDGVPHMTLNFWTLDYSPRGLRNGESGILDALLSSLAVLAGTLLFAVPIGTAAGIYLHEYAAKSRLTEWIRATVSNLAGVPSVVYGLLGLAIFVRGFETVLDLPPGATNLAASLTLGVLILPILIVATEEALKTVPASARQASLALGATQWQTIRSHVLPYSLPGILTGQILALSRAAGETAPLLIIGIPTFALFGFGPLDVGTPLQVRAYFLAQDPREAAINMAAASIVVLLLATLVLNLAAIVLRNRLQKRIRW
ncbi:MAG: phosphate ABC transporter permease PstA [Thermoplasmatota archaeon]